MPILSGRAASSSPRHLRGEGAPIGADEGQRQGLRLAINIKSKTIRLSFKRRAGRNFCLPSCPSSDPTGHLLPASGGAKGRARDFMEAQQ